MNENYLHVGWWCESTVKTYEDIEQERFVWNGFTNEKCEAVHDFLRRFIATFERNQSTADRTLLNHSK